MLCLAGFQENNCDPWILEPRLSEPEENEICLQTWGIKVEISFPRETGLMLTEWKHTLPVSIWVSGFLHTLL